MFDRIGHPARGREGGHAGAPGSVTLDDGTVLRGKGLQFVPPGRRLVLQLPGGGGYGDPALRPRADVERDLRNGYISPKQADDEYPANTGET